MTNRDNQGPEWQQFELEIARLLAKFGYEVVHNTKVHSGQADVVARSKRRTVPDLLIEAKHSTSGKRVSIDEVENFAARVTTLRIEGEIDQGYLVSNAGFTADAKAFLEGRRSAKFVFLVTFDELLATLLDADGYLRSFIETYEAGRHAERYVPLRAVDTSEIEATSFGGSIGFIGESESVGPSALVLDSTELHLLDAAGLVVRDTRVNRSRFDCANARAIVGDDKLSRRRQSERIDSLQQRKDERLMRAHTRSKRAYARCVQTALQIAPTEDVLAALALEAPRIPLAILEAAGAREEPYELRLAWEDLVERLMRLDARCGERCLAAIRGIERLSSERSAHLAAKLAAELVSIERAAGVTGSTMPIALMEDAQASIEAFLQADNANMYVLLGDYGAGKSTVLRHAMYGCARRKVMSPSDPLVRIPLLITLKDYNKVADFEALVSRVLHDDVGMRDVNMRLFRDLNEDGYFALFLDGFDEMLSRVTRADRRRCFYEIARFMGSKSKIVLSGRPGYFPDHAELLGVLEGMKRETGSAMSTQSERRVSCLQIMDGNEIDQYLSKCDPHLAAPAKRLIDSKPSLYDLARRPVLAAMIVESALELQQRGNDKATVRDLYTIYTNRWVEREEDKGVFRLLGDADTKSTFVRYLAMQMHVEGRLSMPFRELDRSIQEHFKLDDASLIDHFSHDIRTCSFLNRSDVGEYSFVHKSFMDFFVALEFERFEESPFAERFNRPLISEMTAFLRPDRLPSPLREALDPNYAKLLGEIADLFIVQKDEMVSAQDFEEAARARDNAYRARKMRDELDSIARSGLVHMKREAYQQGQFSHEAMGACITKLANAQGLGDRYADKIRMLQEKLDRLVRQ